MPLYDANNVARPPRSDASGNFAVTLATALSEQVDSVSLAGQGAVYSAASEITAAASATDLFVLSGSATKTLKVLYVSVTGRATAAGHQILFLARRSTLNSGGTSSSVSRLPHDPNDAASAADVVCKAYSANPAALGTLVGYLAGFTLAVPASSSPAFTMAPCSYDYTKPGVKPFTLRGVNDSLVVNCLGISLAGLIVDVNIVWAEV